jgi:hypothetical protein
MWGMTMTDRLTEAEQTALARLRAGTHVIVPVEPTEDLLTTMWLEIHVDEGGFASGGEDAYRAMIKAAQEGK